MQVSCFVTDDRAGSVLRLQLDVSHELTVTNVPRLFRVLDVAALQDERREAPWMIVTGPVVIASNNMVKVDVRTALTPVDVVAPEIQIVEVLRAIGIGAHDVEMRNLKETKDTVAESVNVAHIPSILGKSVLMGYDLLQMWRR